METKSLVINHKGRKEGFSIKTQEKLAAFRFFSILKDK